MTDDLKAPERIWATEDAKNFGEDRFYTTRPMKGLTEYVRADRIAALEAALDKANSEAEFFKSEVKLRNRIPSTNDTAADLLRRAEKAEVALADMTQQRDAAMAGAVKVKPLVWHEGDEPDEWKSGPYGVWCEFGKFQLYHWAIIMGDPQKTADAAKAAAQAHYNARILSALTPDTDRMLALTAAAYEDAANCTEWTAWGERHNLTDASRKAILARIPADALSALSRIEAQAEARGMRICANIYYERCCTVIDGGDVYREILALADATEAAAKGDNNG